MTKPRDQPDYEKLRLILERELNRSVTLDEAKGIGKCLINVYEVLLSDGTNARMGLDTTKSVGTAIAS